MNWNPVLPIPGLCHSTQLLGLDSSLCLRPFPGMRARVWPDPVVIRYASQLWSSVSGGTCFFFLLPSPSISTQCCSWSHSATQFCVCVCLMVLVNNGFLKSDALYKKRFNMFCFKCTLQMFIDIGNLICSFEHPLTSSMSVLQENDSKI